MEWLIEQRGLQEGNWACPRWELEFSVGGWFWGDGGGGGCPGEEEHWGGLKGLVYEHEVPQLSTQNMSNDQMIWMKSDVDGETTKKVNRLA